MTIGPSQLFLPLFNAAPPLHFFLTQGVDPARVGEAVIALPSSGAFAEIVVASSALTFPVGELSLRVAGGFGWIVPTACDLINTVGRVSAGESVLIHAAAGGVGTLAAQFAKRAGATRIVGVVGTAEQVSYAVGAGYSQVLTSAEFPAKIGSEKFDLVLDPIGGAAREASIALLAPHGRIVIYGNIATFEPVRVSAIDLLSEGNSLLTYNSHLLSKTHPERLAESAQHALKLVSRGEVKIDISAEYELDQLGDAVQRLATGLVRGKSVVRVAP